MTKYCFFSILLLLTAISFSQPNLNDQFYNYIDSFDISQNSNKQLEYSYKMLEISLELDSKKHEAYSYVMIGNSYLRLSNYNSALRNILNAATIYNELGLKDHLASAYSAIGTTYSKLSNYDLAIEYLKRALAIHIQSNHFELTGDAYNNIGEAYRTSGYFDSAFVNFQKAYNNYIQYGKDSIRIAYAQCNLGLIQMGKGNTKEADLLFYKSFSYLRSKNDFYVECITNYEIAKTHFKNRNYKVAHKYAITAYELAKTKNYKEPLHKIIFLLSEISDRNNKIHDAFDYLKQYYKLNDSIISTKNISQMAEMRAEFEISQNEAEMSYLKKINKARANMLIISGIGLLGIIILSIFLYIRSKQRKFANLQLSEYNEELQQKNYIIHNQLEEKEILMKEIHHRVKNNLQIISSIINLQSMRIDNPETIEIFNEMQRRIMAISSIHQKLYQSESVSLINMNEYLSEVIEATQSAFNNTNLNVNYEISIQNVNLNIDAAVSIGLIVNELATNAYKYAFTEQKDNSLLVSLTHDGQSTCLLTVKDNGPGIHEGTDIFQSNSLGLRMVSLLTRQMKGSIDTKNEEGTKIEITFKEIENITEK